MTMTHDQKFSFGKLKELNFNQQKEYITQFFIPLKNGQHVFFEEGKSTIFTKSELDSAYFGRFPKDLKSYYYTEFTGLRNIVYEVNKPLIYDDKINLCPQMPHSKKSYDSFEPQIKKLVDKLLTYVKETMCSNSEESKIYILKWLSNVVKGKKNSSCIYIRGEQGIGKSTLFQFMLFHVLKKLCLESDSEPIKSRFNSILGGKILVLFEELPTFSTSEWMGVTSKLKRYITSSKITLEAKGKDPVDSDNLNNYVILSNNDAIQDDDGRRYFVVDICNERMGDKAYWTDLYDTCFNDEVGHAFYNYLLEIDTTNYNPQGDMPMTKNKLDAFAKRLDIVERFIKDNYILTKKEIYCTVNELFEEFNTYCLTSTKREWGKITFTKRLEELHIKYYKSNGRNIYKIKLEELNNIANARHWIHDIDEYIDEDNKKASAIDEIENLKKENAELKRQLQEMKLFIRKPKEEEPEPEPEEEPDFYEALQEAESKTLEKELTNTKKMESHLENKPVKKSKKVTVKKEKQSKSHVVDLHDDKFNDDDF